LVVRDAICLDLLGRQSSGDMHRDLSQAKLLRGLDPGMADDDYAFLVHDDGLSPAKLPKRGGNVIHRASVDPWVVGIGLNPVDGPEFNLHLNAPVHKYCAGGSEMRSAARVTQAADRRTRVRVDH
jgi:hypothetical protein